VSVDQEGGAVALAQSADHVLSPVVRGLRDPGERVVADQRGDRETFDLEPEPPQLLLDDGLGFVLMADRARSRDESFEERERGVGSFGDRGVEPFEIQTPPLPSMVECLVQIPDDTSRHVTALETWTEERSIPRRTTPTPTSSASVSFVRWCGRSGSAATCARRSSSGTPRPSRRG
jgi:hypothetical protein